MGVSVVVVRVGRIVTDGKKDRVVRVSLDLVGLNVSEADYPFIETSLGQPLCFLT